MPPHPSELTDSELLEAAKNHTPSPVMDAFFIGVLIGVVVFGVAVNSWGFLSIIPLYLIYLFLKKPKQHAAIQHELKKRGLDHR